jgi:hypothetical protein
MYHNPLKNKQKMEMFEEWKNFNLMNYTKQV